MTTIGDIRAQYGPGGGSPGTLGAARGGGGIWGDITGALGTAAHDVGGFLGNAAGDVTQFATQGVPALVGLAANNVALPFEEAYGATGLPGSGTAGHMASSTVGTDLAFGRGALDYYTQKYGPILGSLMAGHPISAAEQFGKDLYSHPIYTGLDVYGALTAPESLAATLGHLPGVDLGGALGRLAERPVQSAVKGALGTATESAIARLPEDIQTAVSNAREAYPVYTAKAEGKARGMLHAKQMGLGQIERMVKKLNPVERKFVFNRVEGIHVPDRVAQIESGLSKSALPEGAPLRVAAEANLAHLRQVPLEWNVPIAQLPDKLRKPIEALHNLSLARRAMIANAYGMSTDTMLAREMLPQNITHGAQWDPRAVRQTPEVAVARQAHQDAKAAHIAAKNAAKSGKPRDIAAVSRAKGNLDKARAGLTRATERARGAFTAPAEAFTPEPAGYMPHEPVPGATRVQAGGRRARSQTSMTLTAAQRSHGYLHSIGAEHMDPSLLVAHTRGLLGAVEIHKALFGDGETPGVVTAMLKHDDAGNVITGKPAAIMFTEDPHSWVLVSTKMLANAYSKAEDLANSTPQVLDDITGSYIDTPTDPRAAELAAGLMPAGLPGAAGDWALIDRNGFQAVKDSMGGARRGYIGMYDRFLNTWKVGILGLSPAFLVHVTLSHLTQYALLSWNDIGAIARLSPDVIDQLHEAFPVSMMGFPSEAGPAKPLTEKVVKGKMRQPGLAARAERQAAKIPHSFLALNDWLQTRIRAAGMLSSVRQVARESGIAAAPDELIRSIERDPALSAQAQRLFKNAMGDYTTFSPFEQNVMRRIFPFYSWLRVATRLAFTYPLDHPLRAEFLNIAAQGATGALDPLGIQGKLPVYERGVMPILGTHLAATMSTANPFRDIAGVASGLQQGGLGGIAQALYSASASPPIQLLGAEVSHTNPLTGNPYYAPPGFGGTATTSHGAVMSIDPNTGEPTYATAPIPSLGQLLAEQIPGEATIRGLLAGSGRPYPTTSDLALVEHALGGGPPASQLFEPPSRTPGALEPAPYPVGTLSQFLGSPVKAYSPDAELAAIQRLLAAYRGAQAATLAQQRFDAQRLAAAGVS